MDKVVDEDYGTLMDYKPEKANFFDVGAKFRQMNGMLTGGINYYVVDWKDRAIRRGVQDPTLLMHLSTSLDLTNLIVV